MIVLAGLPYILYSQHIITGRVIAADNGLAMPGVRVSIIQENVSVFSDVSGNFRLETQLTGPVDISFSRFGYFMQTIQINVEAEKANVLEDVAMKLDINSEIRQEIVMQLSEISLNADDEGRSQNMSATLSSRDVYISQTSFSFSPMRFRLRGYDNHFQTTYINGVHFNTLDRGGFNFSSLGGLNDAMRNRENVYGLNAASFSFGNIGGVSNINTRATSFAPGYRTSVALTNRMYRYRAQATYSTGLRPDGWAFTASGIIRWADEGIIQGTFYNSAGYFLSAEKVFDDRHSVSLVTFGAPTRRASSSPSTQEVYDLAGTTYYNSFWGYQDGKKRTSRVIKTFSPTAILSHDFKIDDKQRLRTGVAYQYSLYSNSALGFYNAADPRPDYYRYLPSFLSNPGNDPEISNLRSEITEMWKTNPAVSQIDWAALYLANHKNNAIDPNGNAKYIVERRHSNLAELTMNTLYSNEVHSALKLTAGLSLKSSKAMRFKTMEDLLGANQWIDIDQFSERDFPANPNIIQNDLRNPNRIIKEGDVFGYNYDINLQKANVFGQVDMNFSKLAVNVGAKLTYTDFYRFGYMENGRATQVGAQSYGKGKVWWAVVPAFKAGAVYTLDGRNRFYANFLTETRAPMSTDAYVSQRIKDTAVPMQLESILSFDGGYAFTYSKIRGRVSVFNTEVANSIDMLGYYDDEHRTFVNHILTRSNKSFKGVEAGISYRLNNSFTFSTAGTIADYRYTNNAIGIKSPENGAFADIYETVLTKDLKLNSGPQLAANFTIDYFHRRMWFVDLTLNYFDNNYLDFAPNRFTEENMAKYTTAEMKAALGTQEKLKAGFMLDASIGRLIYLKDRRSLNFNLSLSNILNNRSMVTGGFQQARLPLTSGVINPNGLDRFPNRYYYAWGFNLFLNVGYRF